MAKMRIYDITKKLSAEGVEVDNKAILAFLETKGISGKTQSSSIDEKETELVMKHFGSSSKFDAKTSGHAVQKPETEKKLAAGTGPSAGSKPENGEKTLKEEKPAAERTPVQKLPEEKAPAKAPAPAVRAGQDKASRPAARPQQGANARPGQEPPKKKKKNIIFSINNGARGGSRQVGQISRGKIDSPTERRGIIKPSVKPSPAPEANIIRPNAQPVKKPAQHPVKSGTAEAAKPVNANAEARPAASVNPAANVKTQGRNVHAQTETRNTSDNRGGTVYKEVRLDRENNNRNAGTFGNNRNGFKGGQRTPDKAPNQGGAKGYPGQDPRKNSDKHKGDGDRRRAGDAKRRRDRDLINVDEEKNERKKANPHGFKKPAPAPKPAEEEIKVITIPDTLTIKDLADHMRMQPSVIIKKLFLSGQVVTVNSEISYEEAENIAIDYDIICEHEQTVDVIAELLKEEADEEKNMEKRPPVVCVMGHVDHGKTSLLDTIRKTHVIEKEAGGITQAIGAYTVSIGGRKITFLDTPGHEAFTAMRMRGANATDIVILVVAADDGVMPQTVEAINHAKAANVEIIVAINKIDKPSANPDRVKQELSEYELIPEEWGGSTVFVPVSAKAGTGVDDLLEMITLTADVMELKADPRRKARGMVIEAELDKGRGPVATVLVQKGTLHVGDFVACGPCHGRVRAMIDDKGKRVKEAGPSIPVEILGLDDVPAAGEIFVSPDSEKEAQSFANTYKEQHKKELLSETRKKSMTLDDLYSQIQEGDLKEFNVIIKADVQGSVEALKSSLLKLTNDEVAVKVIHGGVGAISESDVILASASNAIIIGFNVRPDSTAKAIAETENVDIHLYKIIYQAIEDVESAMKGMLAPVFEEKIIGHGEIRQIFKASGIGNIAGSYVTDGIVEKGCSVRIRRGDEEIFDGALSSLKRFKDDVKEVREGYECGLTFEGFDGVMEGDLLEFHKQVEVERK